MSCARPDNGSRGKALSRKQDPGESINTPTALCFWPCIWAVLTEAAPAIGPGQASFPHSLELGSCKLVTLDFPARPAPPACRGASLCLSWPTLICLCSCLECLCLQLFEPKSHPLQELSCVPTCVSLSLV